MKNKKNNWKLQTLRPFLAGRLPGQLVIQYSSSCNANCQQCGMRRSATFPRHTLEKDTVKRLIDTAAQQGIQSMSFTGGEPLLFLDDIIELINHAAAAGIPFIRTGTNGFLFRHHERSDFEYRIHALAEKIATTSLYTFWISLDSAEAADHEEMRGLPGVVHGIEKALPILHEHGIYPSVNLGINRATGGKANQPSRENLTAEEFLTAFKNSFQKFYTTACNLGFTMANACYPMSSTSELNDELYGAASNARMISFSREEKALIFQALFETIPHFRDKLRIFSPRCSLHSLIHKFRDNTQPLYLCRGGIDFFFVESEHGTIHPCGYHTNPQELPNLLQRNHLDAKCDLCEWECFRDPSDFLGPFAEFFSRPWQLARKIIKDPTFYRILLEDIRYYRACGFFNGREAPNHRAMQKFSPFHSPQNKDTTPCTAKLEA